MRAGSIDGSARAAGGTRGLLAGLAAGRTKYLLGAICIALCTVMLLPLVLSILASLKSTQEAAASPPIYLPTHLSLDSYERLWGYQAGLPAYLANSFGTAFLTIAFTLVLAVPAGYALARFPIPAKEALFVLLLLALIIPYQALLTPIFLMFAQLKLTNSLVGLAILHTAIQLPFSVYILRNNFGAVPRELEEAAVMDGASSLQLLLRIFIPSVVPGIITVTLFAFITSWNEFLGALVMMSKGSSFTLPVVLAAARTEDQPRRHGLGDAPGRGDDLDHPVRRHLPAPPEVLRLGPAPAVP